MLGRTSRSHYYHKAGLRIYVAETNLMDNYRANYIQGIIQYDKFMKITLYGTYSQNQGVIVAEFTNQYYYNLWKRDIGLK